MGSIWVIFLISRKFRTIKFSKTLLRIYLLNKIIRMNLIGIKVIPIKKKSYKIMICLVICS